MSNPSYDPNARGNDPSKMPPPPPPIDADRLDADVSAANAPTDPLGPNNPNFPLNAATEVAAKSKDIQDEERDRMEAAAMPADIPRTDPSKVYFESVQDDGDEPLATGAVIHAEDQFPTDDAKTGAALGAGGGMITGAIAGSAIGPGGTVAGAIIGGVVGGLASGAAVQAVDSIDDDGSPNEYPSVEEIRAEAAEEAEDNDYVDEDRNTVIVHRDPDTP